MFVWKSLLCLASQMKIEPHQETSLWNLEHGNQEIFLQISRRRVRKDLYSNAIGLLNSNIGRDNSTGIQNSKGKLLFFWNSVFFWMCSSQERGRPGKQGVGEPQRRQEEGIPAADGSVHVRAGQQALGETFLGRWNCENNWFTQIFWKEIYVSGWEFRIKSLRGTLCKLSRWTNKTIIIRKKSFWEKINLNYML